MGRKLKSAISAIELAKKMNCPEPTRNMMISQVSKIDEFSEGSLCFAKSTKYARLACSESVLFVSAEDVVHSSGCHIICANPRLYFAEALLVLEREIGFVWSDEEPVIHHSVKIGRNVVIGKGVHIGSGTVIGHNVVIGDEVTIGSDCVIKSGAVIGEDGFGFERAPSGKAVRLCHLGTVKIGNHVEIGSLTTVCRGTLGNTIIDDGAKIDDHVHIAHNVTVGHDAFVIACAEVSGGVSIGKRAWVAPNVSILNQLTIGDDAVVGLGSVVIRNVDTQAIVVGNPAKVLVKG